MVKERVQFHLPSKAAAIPVLSMARDRMGANLILSDKKSKNCGLTFFLNV